MIENSPPNEALSAADQALVRRLDFDRLNSMIDYCTKDGCLRAYILRYFGETAVQDCGDCGFCTGGRYGAAAEAALARRRRRTDAELPPEPSRAPRKIDAPAGGDLFEQLRAVRTALSKQYHVPPYIICSDAALADMVRRKPQSREGMMSVSGMGDARVSKYGDAFLQVIKSYAAQERRMRSQVQAIAREAQSAAFREKPVSRNKPSAASQNQPRENGGMVIRIHEPAPNIPRVPMRESLDDDDEVLADAYLSGVTIQEMADELDVSPAVIRQRLRDMDLIF